MSQSTERSVVPPNLPHTATAQSHDYVFNSVGFYASQQERLEIQQQVLENTLRRLQESLAKVMR
jgi:hypothetical protein